MYLGTTLQYTVRTFHETPVIVHQQNTGIGGSNRVQRGDTVYLKWLPENSTILKAD
ncbi:TOBE domain-containing protein [Candidatus Poribacteria bacterium]|nr:TOBE domain-containing protein [Candidatus Poribacteria bacterium]